MSLIVRDIVLNYIEKREDEDSKALICDQKIELSEKISAFVGQLHHTYSGKPSKGFCEFRAEKSQRFASELQGYRTSSENFTHFSSEATRLFVNELNQYHFPETGYLLFCHYEFLATEYLLVAMLSVKEHFSVDQEMQVLVSRHLDLGQLQLASRINLSDWEMDAENGRYISFIKGRAGRKVADFFLDFLGCEEVIEAKVQSQNMLEAVDDYMDVCQLDKEEKQQVRQELYSYCADKVKFGEDATVQEISTIVGDDQEEAFDSFYNQQGYELEASFPVDNKTIRTLVKYAGQGGGLSINFDQRLLGERILYDPNTDTLTIKGTPPNLQTQLMKEFKK
ncbi:nucleoid-associated protein YejK [Algicola sagamiensis]|uniref:nucleoid-associated protein YejK n=1 Tax=Algicola sagamiensis TaxID=163869 RepID=UPI0003754457|nr:nucleoid-associated protein YejK [Algicola sagamiensis]